MTDTNCNMRFMDNSFIASITPSVSSAASAFPYINVLDGLRSKVFKFDGYWEVTTANQKIYFDLSGAKIATLAAGTYSTTALATEIGTAMNAVSSGFTATHDGTKWNVANASSFELTLTITTDAAWDMLGFGQAFDIAGTSITASLVRIHTHEEILWDLGFNRNATALMAVGPINELFGLGPSATVRIEGNNINDFTAPALSETVSPTELGIYHFIDPADTGHQFWRLFIEDRENPDGVDFLSISDLYLGDYQTMASRTVASGFGVGFGNRTKTSESVGGTKRFDTQPKFKIFQNLSIVALPASERRAIEQMFFDLGISESFYISLDPLGKVSENTAELSALVRLDSQPGFKHIVSDLYSTQFAASEVI